MGPEADTYPSPQGTTGRMVRLAGGDGNYLILHTSGPHAGIVYHVQGCIFMLYSQYGNTRSFLGFPLNEEHNVPGGLQEDFEGGSIYWDRATYHCHVVRP